MKTTGCLWDCPTLSTRRTDWEKVICITNLKPVKLRGELSQGMILTGEKDGVLSLATVDDKLPIGAKVK